MGTGDRPKTRTCALDGCETEFVPKKSHQRFCKGQHQRAHWNETRRDPALPPRPCELCGKPFQPSRISQKFCSVQHAQDAANGRRVPRDELPRDVVELRKALERALRDVDKAKHTKDDLVNAVREASREATLAMTYEPVPAPPKDTRRRGEEIAVVLLSDWQLAKTTPSYNSEVCEERVKRLASKVERLTAIQRADHPVKEVRVYLLGDLIEGELIFPGQAHRIDASMFRQVCIDGPRILGGFLRHMASVFEKVTVAGVIGNHGRIGGRASRDMDPESNADSMLYQITRDHLGGWDSYAPREPRIEWGPFWTPGERHWYVIDQVGRSRFFLFHGDQVRGYAGVPWYGFDRKVKGWNTALDVFDSERFDYACHGHFHTPIRNYINGITVWGNGSTESHNTYALEQLAASGEPSQWLMFVDPERGVSAEYLIRLGDR